MRLFFLILFVGLMSGCDADGSSSPGSSPGGQSSQQAAEKAALPSRQRRAKRKAAKPKSTKPGPGHIPKTLPPPENPNIAKALAAARAKAKAQDALARKLAPAVRDEILKRKYNYDRALLKRFQVAARLAPDGVYGGGSAGALRHWLGSAPPAPLFKPAERKYVP